MIITTDMINALRSRYPSATCYTFQALVHFPSRVQTLAARVDIQHGKLFVCWNHAQGKWESLDVTIACGLDGWEAPC